MTTLNLRGSCNPFKAADDLVKKLKGLQKQAASAVAEMPLNPASLLECLTVGTADRTSKLVHPSYNPYDTGALAERVSTIFQGLARSKDLTVDALTGRRDTAEYGTVIRTSGLWMSKDVANTFYGLVVAKTEDALEDARVVDRQARYTLRLLDDLRGALDGVGEATIEELKKNADTIGASIVPELCALADELRAIAKSVGSSGNLGGSYCGATSLQERIEALLRRIPRGAQPIAPVLRIASQIDEMSAFLEESHGAVVESVAAIPEFRTQIEAGSHITPTEADLHQALADELQKLCDDMEFLGTQRKYAEMQRRLPEVQETLAIALDTLKSAPVERVDQVLLHNAYPDYILFSDSVEGFPDPLAPFGELGKLQFDLSQAVLGWNDDIRGVIDEVETRINALLNFNTAVQTTGEEFVAAVKEEVDQLCVGALRRLIALSGYKQLERNFLYGLFGEFPTMAQETMTTAGILSNCLKDLSEMGNCFGIGGLPGPQRLAFERLSEASDALQRGSAFIGEVAQKIEGFQAKITEQIDELVATIEADARAAIGGIKPAISVPSLDALKLPGLPEIGGCVQSGQAQFNVDPDGWVRQTGGALGPGLRVDSKGYVFADEGAKIPDAFERTAGKYLRAKTPVVNPDAPVQSVLPQAVPAR